MSNLIKKAISLPNTITVEILNNQVAINGRLGQTTITLPSYLCIEKLNNKLYIKLQNENTNLKALLVTYKQLVSNAIIGINKGFITKLKLIGIGYKVKRQDNFLQFKLGYSNTILFEIPKDISIQCIGLNTIYISGINKQRVRLVASQIRNLKKPEIYKGKGIRYADEILNLKPGKKK